MTAPQDHVAVDPAEAFVHELARSPQRSHILTRLKDGHHPDPHGWCSHPAHDHRWEHHPCSTLRLAEWVEATELLGTDGRCATIGTPPTPTIGQPVARGRDDRASPFDRQLR